MYERSGVWSRLFSLFFPTSSLLPFLSLSLSLLPVRIYSHHYIFLALYRLYAYQEVCRYMYVCECARGTLESLYYAWGGAHNVWERDQAVSGQDYSYSYFPFLSSSSSSSWYFPPVVVIAETWCLQKISTSDAVLRYAQMMTQPLSTAFTGHNIFNGYLSHYEIFEFSLILVIFEFQ